MTADGRDRRNGRMSLGPRLLEVGEGGDRNSYRAVGKCDVDDNDDDGLSMEINSGYHHHHRFNK